MIAYSGIDLFEKNVSRLSPVIFVCNITTFYNNGTITVHVKGEVLTPGLEPTTPGLPEESLATRLFPTRGGKKYGTTHQEHVHRGINGTVLRNHDSASQSRSLGGDLAIVI